MERARINDARMTVKREIAGSQKKAIKFNMLIHFMWCSKIY